MPTPCKLAQQLVSSGEVRMGGILGAALSANHRGRLSTFIVDESSPAIAIFAPEHAQANEAGDWYGEHAGKWLCAAAKAAVRTQDAALRARVLRIADYLVSLQNDDGYLGNYAPQRRFMQRQPPKPESWDGAPALRTWDIWTHSYLILGLLEVHRQFATTEHLEAACRIGDLCWRTLTRGGIDITDLGNHHGMSATILMDPALELHFVTGESRYLDLALSILEQAEANPRLALLTQSLRGVDASEIATGKAYQLMWNLVALAKLYRATGEQRFLTAVANIWRSIRTHHLTPGGGPWGGVGLRSREVFNPAPVFSPYGYVETCSTLAWIQLNRELLSMTGEAQYAEEIERSAYNALLGAQAPNGEDWCYYSFPNGKRVHTTYWRCCKSSGALALEELPGAAYGVGMEGAINVNLLGPSQAVVRLPGAGKVRIEQHTRYPFDGDIEIRIAPEQPASFAVRVRVPQWAEGASIQIDDATDAQACIPGHYAAIEREWRGGERITLRLPMAPRAHRQSNRNVQESRTPDDAAVSQEVLRFDYVAVSRGPLVYATGLIDGYKIDETLRIATHAGADTWLETIAAADEGCDGGPDIRLTPLDRPALVLSPYYRADARRDGSWRLTWLSLAPDVSP